MENEFVDIIGYEGKYKIDRNGNVFNTKFNRILKSSYAGKKRYLKVGLCDDNGKQKQKYIHRLLAIHFIPNPDNLSQVDHIDRNIKNNNLSNLRWCDNQLNSRNQGRIINSGGSITIQYRKKGNYYVAQYYIDYNTRITKSSYDLAVCEKFLEECKNKFLRKLP